MKQTSITQPNELVEKMQVAACDCPSLQDMIAVTRIGGLGNKTITKSVSQMGPSVHHQQ